jgi:hypothetical protein
LQPPSAPPPMECEKVCRTEASWLKLHLRSGCTKSGASSRARPRVSTSIRMSMILPSVTAADAARR